MKYLFLYLITAAIFFAIDMLWLGWIAKDFYWKKLDFILSDEVNWPAAAIFYAMYIGGVLYFGTFAGLRADNWQAALLNGALFGFFCYATYDLTNMSLIKNWPLSITIVDILWGTFLTGTTSLLSFFAAQRFLGF